MVVRVISDALAISARAKALSTTTFLPLIETFPLLATFVLLFAASLSFRIAHTQIAREVGLLDVPS